MDNANTAKFFHLNRKNEVVFAADSTLDHALELARCWNRGEKRESMTVELVSNNRKPALATRVAGV